MGTIEDILPALQIRKRPDVEGPAILLSDVDICLDGVPLKGIRRIMVTMATDDVNTLHLKLGVRDVEVDPDFLVALQAKAKVKV